MIDCQIFIEPYKSLRQHSIRTFFTGFGILWAMSLLVFFQGVGNGFRRGTVKNFSNFSRDVLEISINPTATKPLRLTKELCTSLMQGLSFFEGVLPTLEATSSLMYEAEKEESTIKGIDALYPTLHPLEIVEGSFFTQRSLKAGLPICLLNKQAKVKLFGDKLAVGRCIWLHNTAVHVIGVVEIMGNQPDKNLALIPDTFFNSLFPSQIIHSIVGVVKPHQNSTTIQAKTKNYLHRQLQIEAEDSVCIDVPTPKENRRFKILLSVIPKYIWFIGCCLLLSGVVGVSNMMLVVVKERTKELAIRKVVGAGSKHIVLLILLESLIIHLLAGMAGMGLGIGLLKWGNGLPIRKEYDIAHLEPNYTLILAALVVLLIASCLAAIIPAKRALYIKPIDALNNE